MSVSSHGSNCDSSRDSSRDPSGDGSEPRCCFEVFTLFPAAVQAFTGAGLLGKAIEHGRVRVYCTDYRDFTTDRHRTVDDSPFGGGAGMVLQPGPVARALEHVEAQRGAFHRVLLTPSAPRLDQRVAARLARLPRIGLLCGRYEGIDDRIREHFVDECLSVGDFVLNGGEVAALVVIEAVARLVEGVVGNPESVRADSFGDTGDEALLEHPHYTRPADFRGHSVPAVLLGGDHAAIARWRHREAVRRTWALRPNLRPRHRLASGHPIHLALSPSAQPFAAALITVVREHGVAGLAVVGAGPEALPSWLEVTGGRVPVAVFSEPRALRRRLRRGGTGEPRFISVVDPGSVEPTSLPSAASVCERPEILLDLLSSESEGDPLGPLVLWIGPDPTPAGMPIHAIYAPASRSVATQRNDLTPGPDPEIGPGLASGGAIAQSPGPRPQTAALAHAALTQLRDHG
ncbi:MAG: tRNA (guanosine(37)-N1)-methyltransferase TrmD [Myxococcota bacterium]